MKKQGKQKLKTRALRQIAALIILTMIVMALAFHIFFRESALQEQRVFAGEHLSSMISYLGDYIDEVDSIAKDTCFNYYLQNYLMEAINSKDDEDSSGIEDMEEYSMSSLAFSNTLLSRTDVSAIMVFGKKHLLFYQTLYAYRNVISDFSQEEWYVKAVKNPQKAVVTGPNRHIFFDEENEETLSLSRVIQSYQDGSFLGVILIEMNLNEITKICETYQENQEGYLCILNEDGEPVYVQPEGKKALGLSEDKNLSLLREKLENYENDSFDIILNDTKYQASEKTMDNTGWKAVILRSYQSILSGVYNTSIMIVMAVGVVLVIALVALNRILSGIIQPLNNLQKHMERVSLENMNQKVIIRNDDEIGKLSVNFNEMLDRIDNLKEQVVQEQETKRMYELQALQAQINPHFLYNTLDSIIWMAETNDKSIVPITEALAKLFRISLNKGSEEISLTKEIEHVENYLIIQTMRYADKFTYEICVATETEKCRIIKLILQPIVENSIYHGIKPKKGTGHIRIETFRQEACLKIRITDDGCGMTEDMCRKILTDEIESENISGSGIGVKNVNERIRLRFGAEYGLQYYSSDGMGTTVEYTLPFETGDEL